MKIIYIVSLLVMVSSVCSCNLSPSARGARAFARQMSDAARLKRHNDLMEKYGLENLKENLNNRGGGKNCLSLSEETIGVKK